MRSAPQRLTSPRTGSANHLPAAPCPTAGGDTGRSRKLTVGNANFILETCCLPRGRSLGADAVVEVLR